MTKPELAPADAWSWVVAYRDGNFVAEATVGTWAAIDVAGVAFLDLCPSVAGLSALRVEVPEGAEAVFTRRRHVVALGPARRPWTLTIVGWRRGDRGAYLFVADDGHTLLTDDFFADVGEG